MSSNPPTPTQPASAPFWRKKWLLWLLGGLALGAIGVAGLLVFATVQLLDTDRDLSDFANPGEARAFTSAHLPAPLPNDAVVESLHFERWTDWMLTATVRLSSSEAADTYLEEVKRTRTLNDEYCNQQDSPGGARYFLSDVFACGSIERTSPQVISVQCNTR